MKKRHSFLQQKYIRGFTLVEMLVVLGLFSTIMTIASGALFSAQSVNVKLQETQSILDNMNLSVEVMTRDIRYGSDFYATTTTLGPAPSRRKSCTYAVFGCNVLYFKPADAVNDLDRVVYYLDSGILYKKEIPSGIGSAKIYQITAGDINVKSLIFFVKGAEASPDIVGPGNATSNEDTLVVDYEQPLITLTLFGITRQTRMATTTKFTIESSISPREIDK